MAVVALDLVAGVGHLLLEEGLEVLWGGDYVAVEGDGGEGFVVGEGREAVVVAAQC